MSIHNVDLIFLDIEMPVISGFDFLDGLKVKPQIVFITSKAEYAMKALIDATDYLQNRSVQRGEKSYRFAFVKERNKEEEGEHIL
jgi:two-component SAPR family response regulator